MDRRSPTSRSCSSRAGVPLLSAFTLALGACGGSGSGSDNGDDRIVSERPGVRIVHPADTTIEELSSRWLAVLGIFQVVPLASTTGDISLRLIDYDEDFDFSIHADFYVLDLDVCDIDDGENGGGGGSSDGVSGGSNLVLSSQGSTWATIPYDAAEARYIGDNVLPALPPDDLSYTLPGEMFPAVNDVPIVSPVPPVRVSPVIGTPITSQTEYRWEADASGTSMQIVFIHFIDGEFQGFPVTCTVEDDGFFELPADAIAALGALEGELGVRYERAYRQVEFRDGIAVFQRVELAD